MRLTELQELIAKKDWQEDDIHIGFITKSYGFDCWRDAINRRYGVIKDINGNEYKPMLPDANGYVWHTNPELLDKESIFYQEFEAVVWDYITMFHDDMTDVEESLEFYICETDDMLNQLNEFRRDKLMTENGWDSDTAMTYLLMNDALWKVYGVSKWSD